MNQSFAERLNYALRLRGISAAELSKRSGASEGLISGYRKGAYKAKQNRVDKFAQILDVSIPWLMGYDVQMGEYDGGLGISVVTRNVHPIPETYQVPRLGSIACGEPIFAEQNIETYDAAPASIRCDFTLVCKGDSMINARIFDGDIVYIKKQAEVELGQIAAVRINDEATLKKVYYNEQDGRLVLRACNPLYADMVYQGETLNDVEILGLAVGFYSAVRHDAK